SSYETDNKRLRDDIKTSAHTHRQTQWHPLDARGVTANPRRGSLGPGLQGELPETSPPWPYRGPRAPGRAVRSPSRRIAVPWTSRQQQATTDNQVGLSRVVKSLESFTLSRRTFSLPIFLRKRRRFRGSGTGEPSGWRDRASPQSIIRGFDKKTSINLTSLAK